MLSTTLREDAQHELNPLHVYCRLLDAGVAKDAARRLASWWEVSVWPYLYKPVGHV